MSKTPCVSDQLLDLSATEIVAALQARKVSAVELTVTAIARIETRDPVINAVVVRDFDRAREAAKAADAALARGEQRPLLGLPMTVKESHEIVGLPVTWGSDQYRGYIASRNAVTTDRLNDAGAIILGKTNVPELLTDWQSDNPVYGRTRNPWDLTRSPGGSSGGSAAALAAGMTPLEVGGDIGGSIRVPAAFCGVFGHKPSYGIIPMTGHFTHAGGADTIPMACVGPLARSARDLDLALGVLAGPDPREARGWQLRLPPPRHERLADYRVLVLDRHPRSPTDSEVRGAVNAVAARIEKTGASVARSSELLPDLDAQHRTYQTLLDATTSRWRPQDVTMTAHEWMAACDDQVRFQRQWASLFEAFDVVIAPSFGTVAFPYFEDTHPLERTLTVDGRDTIYFAHLTWPGIATLACLPATVVPIGLSAARLPLSVQVIGPYLEDRTTIAFAKLLERELGTLRAPLLH